jgi:hypothetical protein
MSTSTRVSPVSSARRIPVSYKVQTSAESRRSSEPAALARAEERPDLGLVQDIGGVLWDAGRLHVAHRVAALGDLTLFLEPGEELPDPVVAVLHRRGRVAVLDPCGVGGLDVFASDHVRGRRHPSLEEEPSQGLDAGGKCL